MTEVANSLENLIGKLMSNIKECLILIIMFPIVVVYFILNIIAFILSIPFVMIFGLLAIICD